MSDKIVFTKDGVKTTEKVENPITGVRENENVVAYTVFEKYPNLNWKVKAIRPLMKNGVLTGIELEKENISDDIVYPDARNASEKKWNAPQHHQYKWYDEYVLDVVGKYEPISRKEIVGRVYEMISTQLYEGDFYKYKMSGRLRWETMIRWTVTRLNKEGKIVSTGNNDWRIA